MHRAQWLTPSPLWPQPQPLPDRTGFRRPELLRFSGDAFMDEFLDLIERRPADLAGYVATSETWRQPAAGLGQIGGASSSKPLKLYQPVHGRFYLISASLICRKFGLPDHRISTEKGETAGFVLRRIASKNGGYEEYAWVAAGDGFVWKKTQGNKLEKEEQRHPMSPATYRNGAERRLYTGLVPVSRRQAFVTARAEEEPGGTQPEEDFRMMVALERVLEPWTALNAWYDAASADPAVDPNTIRTASEQSSAYILLDFANFLDAHIPAVLRAIRGEIATSALAASELALYNALGAALRQAVRNAKQHETGLEAADSSSGLPAGFVPFELTQANLRPLKDAPPGSDSLLKVRIAGALAAQGPAEAVPRVASPAMEPAAPQGDDLYIIRCFLERPQCGRGAPPLISEASRPFRLASFFDPDAPARPLRVDLPADTTPSGLRKHPKGVAFLVSDELSRQMGRIKDLKSLMDGKEGPPGLSLGFICSLSIPIITICAFIVLMIFIQLLNFVFWWLPFFKICFPVPQFKAKG